MISSRTLHRRTPEHYPLLVWVVCAWLIISSMYYASTLFTGQFHTQYSANELHKGLKYVTGLALSAWLAWALCIHRIIIASGILLAIAALVILLNDTLSPSAVTLISNAAFVGFVLFIRLADRGVDRLTSVLIWSGVMVGIFSIVELGVLRNNLLTYWGQTGGVRSISTLLNPNNLGTYQGACLTLWAYMFNKGRASLPPGLIMMFSLVASGSRTAMVGMILMALIAVLWDKTIYAAIRARIKNHMLAFVGLMVAGLAAIYAVEMISELEDIASFKRGADLHTLVLRQQVAARFADTADWTLVRPDLWGIREVFVQDNAFLSLLNSHGAIVAGLLLWLLVTLPRVAIQANVDYLQAYRHLSIFYLVSGLSNSFLNSFPNNQLFFIAAGAWLCVGSTSVDGGSSGSRQLRASA